MISKDILKTIKELKDTLNWYSIDGKFEIYEGIVCDSDSCDIDQDKIGDLLHVLETIYPINQIGSVRFYHNPKFPMGHPSNYSSFELCRMCEDGVIIDSYHIIDGKLKFDDWRVVKLEK